MIVVPEVRKLLIASRFGLPVNRVIFDIDVELPVHRGVFFVFGCLQLRFRFFGGCRHVGWGFGGIVSVLGEYQRSAHCAGNSFLHGTYKETRFMIGKYCSRGWLQVSSWNETSIAIRCYLKHTTWLAHSPVNGSMCFLLASLSGGGFFCSCSARNELMWPGMGARFVLIDAVDDPESSSCNTNIHREAVMKS